MRGRARSLAERSREYLASRKLKNLKTGAWFADPARADGWSDTGSPPAVHGVQIDTIRIDPKHPTLTEVLDRLASARSEEGARLAPVMSGHLDRIESLVADAKASAAAQPEALTERLRAQVSELLDASPALSEDRLAQEAALLVAKADIREELDRLEAHIEQARGLLSDGVAVGRRLDFLCQEFNREANTLCSKAADVELTRIGLDLKAVIEQFREQVQNIE